MTRYVCALLFIVLLAGCAPEDREDLRGSLYFAAGKYLAALDLRDGSTSVIANLGDAELLSLSPQLDERLLLSVISTENKRRTHQLVLYDIATKQRLTLRNGRFGHYFPGTRVLVFDDGVSLWVTERQNGGWEKTEVLEHRFNANLDIRPISNTRFIYRLEDGPFQAYDRSTGDSIPLHGLESHCLLDRALWIAQREQMLCQVDGSDGLRGYAYVALDGSEVDALPLPGDRDLRPIAYLPDQDVLVFTERWQGTISDRWKWAVWAYRPDTGELYRLLDDQYLGDTVVYSSG